MQNNNQIDTTKYTSNESKRISKRNSKFQHNDEIENTDINNTDHDDIENENLKSAVTDDPL